MLGAVVGDVIGSPYRNEKKDTDFPLVSEASRNTEISVMTLAVAEAIMRAIPVYGSEVTEARFEREIIFWMKFFGRKIKHIRYGKKFYKWLTSKYPRPWPYESSSNGAALRVSPVAWAFNTLEDVERFAEISARVTHNTDEGIKYARVMAGMVFLARMKKEKDEIKSYFQEKTGLELSKTLDEIRPDFNFVTTCPETVSAAVTAFWEGENFEDAVKKSISLGGETNATASMSGAIAEAFSGVRILTEVEAFEKLHRRLKYTVEKWEQWKL
ncbi:MAG: ADP-ribosylglycohydrolase family protein [Synergistaceae bacterium]|nr:ADP-ribosylglycohydrolase family protein [Synergistaceae bacterium]